jgi:hypothetical protein
MLTWREVVVAESLNSRLPWHELRKSLNWHTLRIAVGHHAPKVAGWVTANQDGPGNQCLF